jgi:hypothetical protein
VLRFDQHLMKTQRGSARPTVVMAVTKKPSHKRRTSGAQAAHVVANDQSGAVDFRHDPAVSGARPG